MRLLFLLLLLQPPADAVTLPIEVLGSAGVKVPASLTIPKGKSKTVKSLWLQVNNLSYEGKASVRVGQTWTILNNSTATVTSKYGGIGGTLSQIGTITLTMPVPNGQLKDGPNVLYFRFNGTDGVSSGYRVVGINLQDAAGVNILPESQFKWDDPALWRPPLDSAGDIAEGLRLWKSGALEESPLVKRPLAATCGGTVTGCHTYDGRDLKYFNFSNLSIIRRAEFHGLTETQGKQIASYIRTLNAPAPGRVWYPPYQPGPGLEAKPVQDWAAGGGLEWALPKDSDTIPYLFPNGINKEAVATSGNLNLREIPVGMQFPDWNRWLPRVHPADAWGEDFTTAPFATRYTSIRSILSSQSDLKTYVQSGKYGNEIGAWLLRRIEFLTPKTEGVTWTPSYADTIYSAAQWQLVKQWELNQEFGLEGYGPVGDVRTWYGSKIPFMSSPFMLKIPSGPNGVGGSAMTNEYLSSVWYHVQAVLNIDNQGKAAGQNPMDWSYTYGKLRELDVESGVHEPIRLTLLLAKAGQVWDNPNGINPYNGWNPDNKADISRLIATAFKPLWADTPADTKRSIYQAMLGAWFDKTKTYTSTQYYEAAYAEPSQVPKPMGGNGPFGDKMIYCLPEFRAAGVDTALCDAVSLFCKSVWPLGVWNAVPSDTDN